jgi:hypothetical protein
MRHCPKGSIRSQHVRSDFVTGGDTLEQLIGSTLVDGQIFQLIEEENETTFAIVTRVSGGSMIVHSHEEKKGGRVWLRVLTFDDPGPATRAALLVFQRFSRSFRTREGPSSSRVRENLFS